MYIGKYYPFEYDWVWYATKAFARVYLLMEIGRARYSAG